jgi:hypothetical protein
MQTKGYDETAPTSSSRRSMKEGRKAIKEETTDKIYINI